MRRQLHLLLLLAGCSPGSPTHPNGDLSMLSPMDGALGSDLGGADLAQSSGADLALWGDGGSLCNLQPGTGSTTLSCDLLQLAVMDHTGGASELVLSGRLSGPPMLACALIDGVDIKKGNMVVQHLSGGSQYLFDSGEHELARGGPPVADIANRCASDVAGDRFDVYGIIVTGRVNGGTFTAPCAQAAGGGYWPPALRVTCHRNVETPPNGGDGMVTTQTIMGHPPITSSSLFGNVPHGPGGALTSVNASARIIPWPHNPDPSVIAFDTTWQPYVSEWTGPDPSSQIQLFANGDVFGPKVCPPSSPMLISPVFLARVTGNGMHGAYSTEIFVPFCVATMSMAAAFTPR